MQAERNYARFNARQAPSGTASGSLRGEKRRRHTSAHATATSATAIACGRPRIDHQAAGGFLGGCLGGCEIFLERVHL